MRLTNVENQDTPEDLLNSARNGSSGILRLAGRDANPVNVRCVPMGKAIFAHISVPAYSVPATTKVEATPLIPSANAPGSCQYLNPIVCGPIPPLLMQMARMKKTIKDKTLILQIIS